MNNKIALSIAVTSLAALGVISQPLQATDDVAASKASTAKQTSSGKCASGKCGTEKMYGKVNTDKDPQGQLVQARDGKCGLSGEGHEVTVDQHKQLAEGVCGQ